MTGIARVGLEGERSGVVAVPASGAPGAAISRCGIPATIATTAELLVAVQRAVAGIARVRLERHRQGVEALPAPPAPIPLHLGRRTTTARAATAEVVVGGACSVTGIISVRLEGECHRVEALAPSCAPLALEARDRTAAACAATAELHVPHGETVPRIVRVFRKWPRRLGVAAALARCGHGVVQCDEPDGYGSMTCRAC